MKLQFNKAPLILSLVFTVGLTGCLKDQTFDDGQSQSFAGSKTQVISLGLDVTTPDNVALLAFDNSDNDTTVNLVPVELGGPNNASGDIQVVLEQADDIVDSTNNEDGTDYVIPTADVVSIPSLTVTIPAGTRVGYLPVSFKPSALIGTTYALGFRIKSVTPAGYVIGNLDQGMAIILIKNQYDGKYTLTQQSIGWGAYSGFADGPSLVWPSAMGFRTKGAASNGYENPSSGFGQPMFLASGGLSSLGATDPTIVFDPVTNKITDVFNSTPDDGRGRAFYLNPAVTDSRYDPATKTIYVAYIGTQNGRTLNYLYDTLVYIGPR